VYKKSKTEKIKKADQNFEKADRFGFISLKPKKPNRTEPKQKKQANLNKIELNRKNQAKPVWNGFCPKKLN
jgi:hypothetical protein